MDAVWLCAYTDCRQGPPSGDKHRVEHPGRFDITFAEDGVHHLLHKVAQRCRIKRRVHGNGPAAPFARRMLHLHKQSGWQAQVFGQHLPVSFGRMIICRREGLFSLYYPVVALIGIVDPRVA